MPSLSLRQLSRLLQCKFRFGFLLRTKCGSLLLLSIYTFSRFLITLRPEKQSVHHRLGAESGEKLLRVVTSTFTSSKSSSVETLRFFRLLVLMTFKVENERSAFSDETGVAHRPFATSQQMVMLTTDTKFSCSRRSFSLGSSWNTQWCLQLRRGQFLLLPEELKGLH